MWFGPALQSKARDTHVCSPGGWLAVVAVAGCCWQLLAVAGSCWLLVAGYCWRGGIELQSRIAQGIAGRWESARVSQMTCEGQVPNIYYR
jgi:hypothetical protein